MDEPGDNLLTHTAFTNNQHAEIGRRHLQCDVEDNIQVFGIAYDVVSLLDSLELRILHLADKITLFF